MSGMRSEQVSKRASIDTAYERRPEPRAARMEGPSLLTEPDGRASRAGDASVELAKLMVEMARTDRASSKQAQAAADRRMAAEQAWQLDELRAKGEGALVAGVLKGVGQIAGGVASMAGGIGELHAKSAADAAKGAASASKAATDAARAASVARDWKVLGGGMTSLGGGLEVGAAVAQAVAGDHERAAMAHANVAGAAERQSKAANDAASEAREESRRVMDFIREMRRAQDECTQAALRRA